MNSPVNTMDYSGNPAYAEVAAIDARIKTRYSYASSRMAPVAQLDRVSVSEAEGHRFDSCRARHTLPQITVLVRNLLG